MTNLFPLIMKPSISKIVGVAAEISKSPHWELDEVSLLPKSAIFSEQLRRFLNLHEECFQISKESIIPSSIYLYKIDQAANSIKKIPHLA